MNVWPVDVWTISLLEARAAILSEEEAARAGRFRFEKDRVRWTRARSALRAVLSSYADAAPESLSFAYGPHGKPSLLPAGDVEFNLSHAGDWALIAVAKSVPVGIDIERIRPEIDMVSILGRIGENALPGTDPYKIWTRREARSKAVGGALFDALPPGVCAIDIDAPQGYAAAVALVGFVPLMTKRS